MNAATANKSSTILDHLGYLRAELITVLALFVAGSGYLWLTWNAWPWSGRTLPPTAWIGSLSLIAVAAAAYRLRNLYLSVACGLLLIGSQWGVVCAALAYPLIDTHYLFVVAIILADALAGPRVVIAVSGTSLVFSMLIALALRPV